MESTQQNTKISIERLLPFMDRNYMVSFLERYKVPAKDVEVEYRNSIPVRCFFSFKDKEHKEDILKKLQGKNFDNLTFPIRIEQCANIDSESTNSDGKEIKFAIEYNKLIATVYERSKKEPGLIFKDKEIMAKQDKVISYALKKIGSNLIKGESIMNISLPVNIFDKRTLIQVLAYEMSFVPIFLTRAYYSVHPLERLKWSTAFLVSTMHLSPLMTKPFSPIIGETFQCQIEGLKVYIEQTEHKPLTCNYYMVYSNEDGVLFKIHGFMTTDASTGMNSIKAKKKGKFIIEFNDGIEHEFYFPKVFIKGTTVGKRLFNFRGNSLVIDRKNNLVSSFRLNPDEKGTFVSLFSKEQKTFPDAIKGEILSLSDVKLKENNKLKKSKDCKVFSKIDGEWTNHLEFDDTTYFNEVETKLCRMNKMNFTLPSDSTNRGDLNAFIEGDESKAQNLKEALEESGRADRRLRMTFKSKK